jgi:dTDP-4-amino-4,6-dideoxygalactose transaminase
MAINKVPFLDFYKLNKPFENEFKKELIELIERSWYILGEKVENFEKEYAMFSSTSYCVGVANGLDALILSLKALDIKEGDEVIVPSNTYIASWLAVTHVGAKVVAVEPLLSTGNLDPEKIENKITNRTKAVMAVNLYGQSAELHKINDICIRNSLYLIEDNAQSQGASCLDKPTGSFGIINATSFYPGKNLGALGDAGAITTDDKLLAEKVKTFRNYGSKIKYENKVVGLNSRLDEIQAAFLSIKLKKLVDHNELRIRNAKIYDDFLKGIGDIEIPKIADNCTSVYHIYQIRSRERDKIQKELSKAGIGTMIHYPTPPHLQEAYFNLGFKPGDFPIAELIAKTTLSLPMDPNLEESEIAYICDTIKKVF